MTNVARRVTTTSPRTATSYAASKLAESYEEHGPIALRPAATGLHSVGDAPQHDWRLGVQWSHRARRNPFPPTVDLVKFGVGRLHRLDLRGRRSNVDHPAHPASRGLFNEVIHEA